MANEDSIFGAALPRWRENVSLADFGFAALLLLVFVGLSPFEVRDSAALLHGADESGSGNVLRQVAYLCVFALIGLAAARDLGWKALRAVPISFLLLLGWCIASALWSAEPYVALRRAILECVIVCSVFMGVATMGCERCLKHLHWVLAGVLIVNWLSIPLVPQAIHLSGEADPSLIGDWRGLYFHKNIAGAVSAISAFVFFFAFLESRRWHDALLFAGAAAFAAMTHSKTSLALLPAALLAGVVYRFAWKRALDRQIAVVTFALIGFVATFAIFSEWSAITHYLADPAELSGRAAIWQAELRYIGDHPLLGSGFGSFADTGGTSPLRNYIGSAWIANISHGHSGYLQLLVTIGGVGFALAMWSLAVLPAWRFLKADADQLNLKGLLFAIFVFAVFHNILESDYLESDAPAWASLLLALAMLKTLKVSP
ncbi:MAG TPA: O-antigen ligase family protein [Rhizomicrobium sp.]|nr:O-antigen ligase family protein [Rhizomicrobium sp.]